MTRPGKSSLLLLTCLASLLGFASQAAALSLPATRSPGATDVTSASPALDLAVSLRALLYPGDSFADAGPPLLEQSLAVHSAVSLDLADSLTLLLPPSSGVFPNNGQPRRDFCRTGLPVPGSSSGPSSSVGYSLAALAGFIAEGLVTPPRPGVRLPPQGELLCLRHVSLGIFRPPRLG